MHTATFPELFDCGAEFHFRPGAIEKRVRRWLQIIAERQRAREELKPPEPG